MVLMMFLGLLIYLFFGLLNSLLIIPLIARWNDDETILLYCPLGMLFSFAATFIMTILGLITFMVFIYRIVFKDVCLEIIHKVSGK